MSRTAFHGRAPRNASRRGRRSAAPADGTRVAPACGGEGDAPVAEPEVADPRRQRGVVERERVPGVAAEPGAPGLPANGARSASASPTRSSGWRADAPATLRSRPGRPGVPSRPQAGERVEPGSMRRRAGAAGPPGPDRPARGPRTIADGRGCGRSRREATTRSTVEPEGHTARPPSAGRQPVHPPAASRKCWP
ncbi:MAG: hypothetical protein ACK52I_24260 [Pseudomonadota bacterium]